MQINKSKYKNLRAKVDNNKQVVYNFDRTVDNVLRSLIPTRAEPQGNNSQAQDHNYAKQLSELNGKLANSEKRADQMAEDYRGQVEDLSKKVSEGDEQNLELSESLRAAIENIYRNNAEKQKASANNGSNPSVSAEQQGEEVQQSDYANALEAQVREANKYMPAAPDKASPASAPVTSTTAESSTKKTISKALKIGEFINVGDYKYRVTNTFGIREGENSVPGREGKHSGGIDVVGYDKQGNKANTPIALADGKIISITLQGNGKPIHPTQGAAAGYMMKVQMDDNKIMTYMHLGEDVLKNKASLINKRIKRGDILYEGDYSKGSGSQTAPHIKVRVSSMIDGKIKSDHTLPENDPSTYALNGKYSDSSID